MIRRRFAGLVVLAGPLALVAPLRAQGEKPADAPAAEPAKPAYSGPPAREIVERHIEVTGGRKAYEALKNRVSTGKMEIPMQNLTGTTSVTQAAPNKMMMKIDLGGFGSQQQVTDGEIAWTSDTMQGARLLEGEEKEALLRQATFNSELNWETLYTDVVAESEQIVEGKPAYAVKMVAPDGQKITNFYDKESGLLVRTSTVAKSPMGEMPMDSVYQDYKQVDGITMAHRTVISTAMGMQIIMTIESVKHNVELAPDTFTPPEEIKAMLAAQKAGGGTAPSGVPASTPKP